MSICVPDLCFILFIEKTLLKRNKKAGIYKVLPHTENFSNSKCNIMQENVLNLVTSFPQTILF